MISVWNLELWYLKFARRHALRVHLTVPLAIHVCYSGICLLTQPQFLLGQQILRAHQQACLWESQVLLLVEHSLSPNKQMSTTNFKKCVHQVYWQVSITSCNR